MRVVRVHVRGDIADVDIEHDDGYAETAWGVPVCRQHSGSERSQDDIEEESGVMVPPAGKLATTLRRWLKR